MQVYIGIGGNLPETPDAFQMLAEQLKRHFPQNLLFSPVYKAHSFQNPLQPDYLNACAGFKLTEPVDPLSVLNRLLLIEEKLGRYRSGKVWENRIIDIDILVMGNLIIQKPELTVPHYQLTVRDFFLLPLQDLAPQLKIPPEFLGIKHYLDKLPENLKTFPQQSNIVLNG